jgi:serine/threonine protein phosphatase 1
MYAPRIYAIGDIHGCARTLKKLMEQIQPAKNDTLVFLGDYIDRGPRIKDTIDFMINLKENGYRVIYLMGNHEWMLLDSFENNLREFIWRYNGAKSTLKSFGISEITQLDSHYLQFFKNLEFYWQSANFLFVHAGFSDIPTQEFEDIQSNLWTRNETYTTPMLKDMYIIHGHTPTTIDDLMERIDNGRKVLNIDTGCVYYKRLGTGALTALEIPSFKVYSAVNCD